MVIRSRLSHYIRLIATSFSSKNMYEDEEYFWRTIFYIFLSMLENTRKILVNNIYINRIEEKESHIRKQKWKSLLSSFGLPLHFSLNALSFASSKAIILSCTENFNFSLDEPRSKLSNSETSFLS